MRLRHADMGSAFSARAAMIEIWPSRRGRKEKRSPAGEEGGRRGEGKDGGEMLDGITIIVERRPLAFPCRDSVGGSTPLCV